MVLLANGLPAFEQPHLLFGTLLPDPGGIGGGKIGASGIRRPARHTYPHTIAGDAQTEVAILSGFYQRYWPDSLEFNFFNCHSYVFLIFQFITCQIISQFSICYWLLIEKSANDK
jgi:hypothetical protein